MRRHLLVFLPSLLTGLVGAGWLLVRPFPYTPTLAWPWLFLVGAGLAGFLLGGAWVLEQRLESFREVSRQTERLLRRLRLSPSEAVLLAVLTSLAEEVFFRGALLPLLGVWGQAVIFGLLHPAGRRGWAYTLYTFVAGVLFGYAALLSGSLWPSLLAHGLVNLQGLWQKKQMARGP